MPNASPALAVQRGVATLLAALPDAWKVRLSGRPPVRIDGEELEPGVQLSLRLAQLRGSASLVSAGTPDVVAERHRIRGEAELTQGRRTPVGAVRELAVDGGRGSLRARHFAPPRDGAGAPLLVFFHGGGWVFGDLDTHDELCRLLCRHAGVHVVSVAYSLAPEHPFPAAVEDAEAAVAWALRSAASLGADPERVAVGGDSAGGNLSAVCCQAFARDPALLERAGGRAPVLQVLLYPGTDLTAHTSPSDELFAHGFLLDAPSRAWFQGHYLSGDAGVDPGDPRVSPLYGEVSGVAPAIVVTAAFDPLRDEGEAYAAALRRADVPVVCLRVPGMLHAFGSMTGVNRAARDAVLGLAGMIRAGLATPRGALARA